MKRRCWSCGVIGGLWAGLMYQFWDMWRMNLLSDSLYTLIPELVALTVIAISGVLSVLDIPEVKQVLRDKSGTGPFGPDHVRCDAGCLSCSCNNCDVGHADLQCEIVLCPVNRKPLCPGEDGDCSQNIKCEFYPDK